MQLSPERQARIAELKNLRKTLLDWCGKDQQQLADTDPYLQTNKGWQLKGAWDATHYYLRWVITRIAELEKHSEDDSTSLWGDFIEPPESQQPPAPTPKITTEEDQLSYREGMRKGGDFIWNNIKP